MDDGPERTPSPVSYRLDDTVAVVDIDDGKANALSPAVLDDLDAALTRAEGEARALLLVGRPGRFSAGFDLRVMTAGAESVRSLVGQGGRLLMRICQSPLPVVAACSGHAIAAGALTLLACDHRVGADVDAKIGLNELGIGMPLPHYAVALARHRLTTTALTPATLGAQMYDPAGAAEVGYLDRVVPADDLVAEALADARRLAGYRSDAFRTTKRLVRGALAADVLATIDDDLAALTGPQPG